MRHRRMIGSVLAAGGGGTLTLLLWQSLDAGWNARSIYWTGMPGDLLLGCLAIGVLAYGLHLAVGRPPWR